MFPVSLYLFHTVLLALDLCTLPMAAVMFITSFHFPSVSCQEASTPALQTYSSGLGCLQDMPCMVMLFAGVPASILWIPRFRSQKQVPHQTTLSVPMLVQDFKDSSIWKQAA